MSHLKCRFAIDIKPHPSDLEHLHWQSVKLVLQYRDRSDTAHNHRHSTAPKIAFEVMPENIALISYTTIDSNIKKIKRIVECKRDVWSEYLKKVFDPKPQVNGFVENVCSKSLAAISSPKLPHPS